VTSVWILGDQLLDPHPALALRRLGAAERRAVRASARTLLARLDRA
jgi:hypothetical protein